MKKKSLFICCFLIVLTTVGACSSKTEEDSNVQSIKTVLKEALTDRINDREVYMKGIDHSYYYEGYTTFKTEEL